MPESSLLARPRPLRAAIAALLVALTLTACGGGDGQGSRTDCGLDGCTITFARGDGGQVSVLGITARLVGVDAGFATIEVAGNTVRVPVGGETAAGDFTVGVQEVTDSEVVVRVRLGGGGGAGGGEGGGEGGG
ncbi:MAG TPA: hypothetical protein VEZ42_14530 [Pseudonocardia sp.]|nr:hypothetical protein [Pseudonocardia sp.]